MTLKSFDDPNSDEARQFLLDRRCERKHPKRHRTLKRRRAAGKKKKAKIAHRLAEKKRKHNRFKARVRAYWAGVGDYPQNRKAQR